MANSENARDNQETVDSKYPAAIFLVDTIYQDYIRLMDSYNKIYDKLNIILVFVGIILGIIINNIDLKIFQTDCSNRMLWQVALLVLHVLLLVISIILMIYSIYMIFKLLKGKGIYVFKSEDLRNNHIYRETVEVAAMWLIDKYTECTASIRPVLDENQKDFQNIVKSVTLLILILITVLFMQKVGY